MTCIPLQPHRDTEKVQGMFGTLVIQLPSDYEGGTLRVYHRGEELTFDFSHVRGGMGCHYAAFYGDCQHEVCEVTRGYRLCLIYNLVYSGVGARPVPADNKELIDRVAAAAQEWGRDPHGPPVLAYMLTHQYCEASLSFQALKNVDRAAADVLVNAKKQVKFHLYVGQVILSQKWSGYSTSYFDYTGKDGYEVEDLIKENLTVSPIISPSGRTIPEVAVRKEDVVPEGYFDDEYLEPEEEEFEEATGNAGATIDRLYQQAALIMWPKRRSK